MKRSMRRMRKSVMERVVFELADMVPIMDSTKGWRNLMMNTDSVAKTKAPVR